ncbi:MAG: FliH/SctL family protein [bacterium]|nr:FliH/SctL family protein [bacterium]
MFSFRPDSEASAFEFIPTPLTRTSERVILPVEQERPADDPVEDAAREVVALVPTPEEIAVLEQAAFDRGVESARAEQDALAATCRKMDRAIAEWRAAVSSLVTTHRRGVLDLTRALVAQWVQAELVTDPELYAAYLDRALDGVADDDAIRLHLTPTDRARLEAGAPEALARWQDAGVTLTTDDELGEASFRIDTATAGIEGDLATLADRLRETLAPAISAPPPGDGSDETEEGEGAG